MSSTPDDLFEGVRTSTAALVETLGGGQWTDDYVRGASLLAGWTRGHVLTHIARNADGITAHPGRCVARRGRPALPERDGRPRCRHRGGRGPSGRRSGRGRPHLGPTPGRRLRRDLRSRAADVEPPGRQEHARAVGRRPLARGRDPPRRPGRRAPSAGLAGGLRRARTAADRRHARRARGNRRAAREDHPPTVRSTPTWPAGRGPRQTTPNSRSRDRTGPCSRG